MLSLDLGIDLGSTKTAVYVYGKGVVLCEPSVVAVDSQSGKVIAMGRRARRMIGRNPDSIRVVHPIVNGVVADYDLAEQMLRHFVQKVCGNSMFKPRAVVAMPSIITNVDKLALFDAVMAAGCRKVCMVEKPLLASLGAGVELGSKRGSVIIDAGGGTLDTAVVTYGGLAFKDALKIGGITMDEAISRYVNEKYNIKIGERTSEDIRIEIGCAYMPESEVTMSAKGLNATTGLPDTVELSNFEIYEVIKDYVMKHAQALAGILEKTPPELVADISIDGIHIAGGAGQLKGFDKFLYEYIRIPAFLVPEPDLCVVRGTAAVIENIKQLKSFGYAFKTYELADPVGIDETIYND